VLIAGGDQRGVPTAVAVDLSLGAVVTERRTLRRIAKLARARKKSVDFNG